MSLPRPQEIKLIATKYGYIERRDEVSKTLFFKNSRQRQHPTLINVFYTTGGIMTKLSHPRSGYNSLWRSDAYNSKEMLDEFFENPRIHTGKGYRRASGATRGCIKCGMQKYKSDFSKNQWRKGPDNAKCADCIEPSNGDQSNQTVIHGISGLCIGDTLAVQYEPNDVAWNTITDAITCDAKYCNNTSPTLRCNCACPVYYCSERCKRSHSLEHREDCLDLEHFRRIQGSDYDCNINSGLCNANPSNKSKLAGYAMATKLSGKKTIEALLLQAEYIHQEDKDWKQAIALYQEVLMMGGHSGENLSPAQCRTAFMGLARCSYELGIYDKAIYGCNVAIEMNRGFPQVHKYIALSHKARGNLDLAIKTMKEAVLYEAPYSDETILRNKEFLCELLNEHIN